MAVRFVANSLPAVGLFRDGTYFNPGADWTIAGWAFIPALVPSGFTTYWIYGDGTFGGKYIWIGTGRTPDMFFEVFDGSTFTDVTLPIPPPDTWVFIAATYTSSTHTISVTLNNGSPTTAVVDLSAIAFAPKDEHLLCDSSDPNGQQGVGGEDFGIWQRKLTSTELVNQQSLHTPVSTTNLLSFTPLKNEGDLADSFSTHDWAFPDSSGLLLFLLGPTPQILTEPVLLVEIYLTKFPASLGTTTLRLTRSQRPRALTGAFYEPRIKSMSRITHSALDPDGNYQIGSVTLTIDDSDSELGALLAEFTPTEYFSMREVAVWVISREGLDAGLTPANTPPVHRGWISDSQKKRRDVTITSSDVFGSQMSGQNLDKKVLQTQVKNLTDNARPENKEKYLPIALGEYSDRGAEDVDGNDARKGLWPVIEVCEVDINAISGAPPAPTFGNPPVITQFGTVGTTGEKTLYYAASMITPLGETGLSNIVACNGASVRNAANYNWLGGTFDEGSVSPFNKVRIWVSEAADASSFHLWLDEADYFAPTGNFCYGDGNKVTSIVGGVPVDSRLEVDTPKELMPSTNGGMTSTNVFSIMAVCLGYDYDLLNILGSNLADGTEPKRVILPDADYGVTTIRPTDPQWPYPNPWIEMNGVIFTAFLQRGNVLNAHRDGSVTMAVNFCGPNIGGLLLNQVFYQRQFLLNEYCIKNKGTGWRNQTYGTLETFANGDPILQTSSFAACQNMTINWIGGLGYIGNIWVVDPNETWRDVSRKFFLSFGSRESSNRFGQIVSILINTVTDTVLPGRQFRERIEIKRSEEPHLAHDQVINQITWNYFYDEDAGAYKAQALVTKNDDSIAAHVPGGVVGGNDLRGLLPVTRDVAYTNDETTAIDSVNRELSRRGRRPRYPVITVGLLGLDYNVGDRCRLTDTEGLGPNGDVDTRCIILQHETDLDNQEVTLTLQVLVQPIGVPMTSDAISIQDTVTVQMLTVGLLDTGLVQELLKLSQVLSTLRVPLTTGVLSEQLKLSQTVAANTALRPNMTETLRLSESVSAALV